MKNIILKIIAIFLIVLGIFIIIFPKFSNKIYEEKVRNSKDKFIQELSNKTKLDYLYEELQNRNQLLYEKKQENLKDPFSYEEANINLEEYGITENMIGFLKIPKLNIELPIFLGANTENMKKGAVHLTETSYPIGGNNTNSVIAAHRGYSKAKMFRNIDNLIIGDEIYISNFKEKLNYKVVEIKIINPSDINELLIQEGRDLVTLVTCHPYRVNNKRYIVFCERVIK